MKYIFTVDSEDVLLTVCTVQNDIVC